MMGGTDRLHAAQDCFLRMQGMDLGETKNGA